MRNVLREIPAIAFGIILTFNEVSHGLHQVIDKGENTPSHGNQRHERDNELRRATELRTARDDETGEQYAEYHHEVIHPDDRCLCQRYPNLLIPDEYCLS